MSRLTKFYKEVYHNGKKVREHRVIAELALGKELPRGIEVHHVDEDPTNNSNINLVICPSRSYHCILHRRKRAIDAGQPAHKVRCSSCNDWFTVGEMNGNRPAGWCKECHSAFYRKRGMTHEK